MYKIKEIIPYYRRWPTNVATGVSTTRPPVPTDFTPFPKIGRLSRGIVITEKLDGTNVQVCITDDGEMIFVSRNRWITPDDDNHDFARWGVTVWPRLARPRASEFQGGLDRLMVV